MKCFDRLPGNSGVSMHMQHCHLSGNESKLAKASSRGRGLAITIPKVKYALAVFNHGIHDLWSRQVWRLPCGEKGHRGHVG